MIRDAELGNRIECGLAELLGHFGRSVGRFDMHHDVVRDRKQFRVVINTPWGEQVTAGCDLQTYDLMDKPLGRMVFDVILTLFHAGVSEQDIKEEVANESLPPEALDTLERVTTYVSDSLVVQ